MDPNSAHQLWSRWTWTVRPGRRVAVPFEPIKATMARFARQRFGSAGQMRIVEQLDRYIVEVRIEGKPAHDPDYVRHERVRWHMFFLELFGIRTEVELAGPKIEAGSRQDGTPPDQLIILPSIPLT